ncbi:MAG TPA: hypothetical protein VFM25_01580 [Verrucomicrobiae bacterium]|nr:hypothetical protein [Verrucomicrobiae bacterium]
MIIFVGIAGLCGFIVSLIMRRKPLWHVVVLSFVIGTVAPGLPVGILQGTTVLYPEHHSVLEAVISTFVTILYCLAIAPFICGCQQHCSDTSLTDYCMSAKNHRPDTVLL